MKMKKKNFFVLAVLCLALVVGIFSKVNSTNHNLSTLQLQNLEAFSEEEESGRYRCYSSIVYKEGASVVECSTCESREDHTDALFCFHDWCYR